MTVEEFNEKVKVGDDIWYTDDFGVRRTDTIKYPASVLPSGHPVMWLEGKRGCYDLNRFAGKCPIEVKE